MTYRYGDYALYTREVELQSGRQQTIYFFAKGQPKSGVPCNLPKGYAVKVSERTGMPLLKKDPNAVNAQSKLAWVRKIFGR